MSERRTCNRRIIGYCLECNHPVEIGWTIGQSALPDGGTHEHAGDMFIVTQKCHHIYIDGGYADGLDSLLALVKEVQTNVPKTRPVL